MPASSNFIAHCDHSTPGMIHFYSKKSLANLLAVVREWHVGHKVQHASRLNVGVIQQRGAKIAVLVTTRHDLGHEKISNIQAVTHAVVRGSVLNSVHPVDPAARQDRCLRSDPLRVIAKGLMECRPFTDGSLDLVRQFGGH